MLLGAAFAAGTPVSDGIAARTSHGH
jgi:hypothetical protein